MNEQEFVAGVIVICATMAVATGTELAAPLFAHTSEADGRARVNLGLTALTLALNWALNSAAAVVALAFSLGAHGVMARLGISFSIQSLQLRKHLLDSRPASAYVHADAASVCGALRSR